LMFIEKLEEDVAEANKTVRGIGNALEDDSVLIDFLRTVQNLMLRTKHASSFTYCLTAQDVTDQKAKTLYGRSKQNEANLQNIVSNFAQKISEIDTNHWQKLVSNPEIRAIQFPLDEMRQQVIDKLPSLQEELMNDLAVEGYHSWMSLYTTLIRRMRIPFERDGKSEAFSIEKLERVFSSSNRQERELAFLSYMEAFKKDEEVYSSVLNNLTGYRLKMYKHRGWSSVLKESLELKRMSQETLEAMWKAVAGSKEKFSHYFERKAELLGIDKMSWFDQQVSISEAPSILNFKEGVNFILERFRGFSPRMAGFAEKAFEERWVETENRPKKSPMGFHIGFPMLRLHPYFPNYL
jgi:oligoendopeptidase F